jgi:hypothetical protein
MIEIEATALKIVPDKWMKSMNRQDERIITVSVVLEVPDSTTTL